MSAEQATEPASIRHRSGGILVLVGLCVLAGCGMTRADHPTRRGAPIGAGDPAAQPNLSFLTLGSRPMDQLVAGIGSRTRMCPQVRIALLNGDSPMEIDIFGPNPPRCVTAIAQLRRARLQLRQGVSDSVAGWRYVWTPLPAVGCRRGGSLLAASNPGG
jgi:hypothetical protein